MDKIRQASVEELEAIDGVGPRIAKSRGEWCKRPDNVALVEKLRQSKLGLERRAAAAEAELEATHEHEPRLLRRLFDLNRGL